MAVRATTAKSIVRTYKRIDSWFVTRYNMNLYRGCFHDCAYCDGRAEKYNVEGSFGRDIGVKTNALEILDRELDPARHRVPRTRCYVMVGGGINDSYQPAERTYRLTRGALEILLKYGYPVSILTKSPFITEDLGLIKEIARENGAIVGCSFSSVDRKISRVFEPTVASPQRRLEIISTFKAAGVPCTMFLMPVIPLVTDSREMFEESLTAGREAGADYVVFSGMTLKAGRQMDRFMKVLTDYDPSLVTSYRKIYGNADQWGGASAEYQNTIHKRFYDAARRVGIPVRMPRRLFAHILEPRDRVVVILEHMDYIQKLKGVDSHYGYAAHSISKLKEPIDQAQADLQRLPGVGPFTEKIVREILSTGTSAYYEKLMGEFTPASPPRDF